MKYLRNRHLFLLDLLFLPIAVYFSFALRLESLNFSFYLPGFFVFSILTLVCVPLFFLSSGLYSRYWRYASVDELLLLGGTLLASVLAAGGISVMGAEVNLLPPIPKSIPFIFLLLALAATASSRMVIRLAAHHERRDRGGRKPAEPVLIMGAGDAGALIVRELQHNPQLGMEVIGFLDDDPFKQKVRIHGVPVLGDRYLIKNAARLYGVRKIIIAMPATPGKTIREIIRLCEKAAIQAQTIPGIYELLDGTTTINQLREVNIEDLLRREPIQTGVESIQRLVRAKRVLVTGGGGSIGSELCRQIALSGPSHLILLGHGENSIFTIDNELRSRYPHLPVTSVIADIRDLVRLKMTYESYRPEIIFHAAAHKHVPLMEANPCEAITNNVLGTKNLVELAAEYGVAHFVLISTDKAVNPTNIMGASKRCAERIVHKVAQENKRSYAAVRFGNVLGSRGSVVPLFKQQIAAGGPVTVTDPEMRRFFMTIPEAVQLVLQAAALGKGGEVFVLDMGEPVKIVDLAQDLIELSGLRPHEDIEIKFTGLRPGEKLYEELFIPGETYTRTHHQKIFVAQGATEAEVDLAFEHNIRELIAAAQRNDTDAIPGLLQKVVPEYQPPLPPQEDSKKASIPAAEPLLRIEERELQGHANGNQAHH